MKKRQFLVFPYPEKAGLAPSWASEFVRDGKDEKRVPTEAVGGIQACVGEGKMEILVRNVLSHKLGKK